MAFTNGAKHILYQNVIKVLMHVYNLQSQQNTIIHFLEYSFTVIRLICTIVSLFMSIIVFLRSSGIYAPHSMGAIGTMRSPHYARELDKQAFECKENDC
jgi:hypothetical protein